MIGIIWILIGVVLLGYYNALLLLDNLTLDSDPANGSIKNKWHFIGACIFLYLSATTAWIWGIKYVPFSLSCFWAVFAGIVHMVGLNRPFFYVGTTAKTDILLRKWFPNNPQIGSAIMKIGAIVISLLLITLF